MPTLNIESVGQTGCQWYISGLSYPWNGANYSYAYISINGYASQPIWPPSTGSSYSTSWGNYSGLSAGTAYTAYAYVYTPSGGGPYSAGSASFRTSSPPQPPIGTPSVSASAVYTNGQHYIDVSWTSVSGATGYHIYANNVYKTPTTSLYSRISVDYEYTVYSVTVYPYNSVGNGSPGTTSVRTPDKTPPTITGFGAPSSDTGATYITVNATATDSGSGVNSFYFYKNGIYDGVAYGTGVSYQYTGLTPQTTYSLSCKAFDMAGNDSAITAGMSVTTKSNRPTNFYWTNSKSSGGNFNLTAAEWNALAVKINSFRAYKNLNAYGFTTAYSGNNYEANHFNQAVTAINAMSPPTTLPNAVSSGQTIYASQLNGLVSSLNSIL